MKIGLLQSSYLPWLGYFDQIHKCDIFIFYEDVQFEEGSWRNRNRIRTKDGWTWLTVPVYKSGRFGQKIFEVKINNTVHWQKKHLRSFELNYRRTPYFHEYYEGMKRILDEKWDYLSILNMELIRYFCVELGISTQLMSSMDLEDVKGRSGERVYSICSVLGASAIIVGDKAMNYLNEDRLTSEGISIEYQNYNHPEYTQQYSPFIPYLSIVDLLFNEGKNSLKKLHDKSGGIVVNPEDEKNAGA